MKNLKFKRYNVGDSFEPTTAETNTIHLVPVSTEPLTVKAYDVDEHGNVAEISFDGWQENKDIILEELKKYKDDVSLKYNDNAETKAQDILNFVDKNTGENVNYREVTTWHDDSAMNDEKADGVIYRKIGVKYYKRQFEGALNVKWFGVKGEGLINNDIIDRTEYDNILECFKMALLLKKDIFFPSGTYNVGQRNFPFKTFNPEVEQLFDCKNITIFGSGDSTVLMTESNTGADVLNLHKVKNLHFKDLSITGVVNNLDNAGTNGISIVSGYENLTFDNIYIFDLFGVPKGGDNYDDLLIRLESEFNPETNEPPLRHDISDGYNNGDYFIVNNYGTKAFSSGGFIYTLNKGDIIFKKNGIYDVVRYYVDGGKALTLQNDNSILECGTLKANIRVSGCGYGFGMDYQITNLANKKTAINIDMIAENCHRGISFNGDGTDATELNDYDGTNINIKANLINCQTDLHLTTIKGVNMDLSIQTTKTAEQRRKIPNGSRYWNEYEKCVKVCDLLYVKDSFITIYGNKGEADYKYRIGAYNANSSSSDNKSTSRNVLNLNVSADSEKLLILNNIGGNFIANNIIYFMNELKDDFQQLLFYSNRQNIIYFKDGSFQTKPSVNKIGFLDENTRTEKAIIYQDMNGIAIKQVLSDSPNANVVNIYSKADNLIFGVNNDGTLKLKDRTIQFGSDLPNNVIGAKKGSIYFRENSNASYSIWLKNTGANEMDKDGWVNIQTVESAGTAGRPNLSLSTDVGKMFFDVTLNIPIWWDGTKWIKADGTIA